VLIVDVDHFKSINDRYGHPAGDWALIEIADRLRAATRPGDVLARYGGEEFALLVPGAGPAELAAIAERIRHHVSGSPVAVPCGTFVVVTVSVGAVSYPHHGQNPADLVAAADRALYRAKALGRDRVAIGEPSLPTPTLDSGLAGRAPMVDFLRRVSDEIDTSLSGYEHSTAISRWAANLATRLGQDDTVVWRTELAGRLHDIGKIVVPEAILGKPAALTESEWLLMRQHPDHGARLARLVPGFDGVAETIRQHHERFDGTGYPDRLAGNGIRVEARILAVCDSWAAMRSDRPYQAALSEEQARDELWGGRGSQFDPDLVDLFLALHEQGLIGDLQVMGRVFQKLAS
jgi:diguanylate cyclase (GGDEF)-like protein/putative nucleotidyltransferase with HDIG domain